MNGMRANLPGVGNNVALSGKESWRIDSRKTWFVSSGQTDIISFTILHLHKLHYTLFKTKQ